MAEIVRLPVPPRLDNDARLDVVRDEFSIKVCSAADPRFWVRMEIDDAQGPVVTDFNPGRLGTAKLMQALLLAIGQSGIRTLHTLVFRDVLPGAAQSNQGQRLIASRKATEDAVEYIAAESGQTIDFIRLEEQRGKLNIRVGFR